MPDRTKWGSPRRRFVDAVKEDMWKVGEPEEVIFFLTDIDLLFLWPFIILTTYLQFCSVLICINLKVSLVDSLLCGTLNCIWFVSSAK